MTSLLTFVSITPHLNQGGVNKKRVTKIINLRPRIRKGNRNHVNTNRPIIDMKLYGLETAVRVNAGKRALGSAWWIGSQFRPTTLAGQTRYILKMSSVNLPRTMQYIQGMPSWRTNDPARSKLQGGHQGGGMRLRESQTLRRLF